MDSAPPSAEDMDSQDSRYADSGEAPWLRNEGWARRRIPDQAIENLLIIWIAAVVCTVASLWSLIPKSGIVREPDKMFTAIPLIFLAFGIGLIAWALYRTFRITKFGDSVFHLQTLPAIPGGELAGVIHVQRPIASSSPITMTLSCIRRTRGGGRGGEHEHVIWKTTQTVDHLEPSGSGADIPVSIQIPADAAPTSNPNFAGEIFWRLQAKCRAFGVGYRSQFEVPVFVTDRPQPPPAPQREIPIGTEPARAADWTPRFTEPGITCGPADGGVQKIHLAAGRNTSSATLTTCVGLGLTGTAIAIIWLSAGSLMFIPALCIAVIFLLIGGVFDYIAFYYWFVSQDVTVQRGQITTETGTPLFSRYKTFQARDISEILVKVDSGSSVNGSADMQTAGVMLKTRDGKTVWLANNISQKRYADWLAEEIQNTLGR